LGWPEQIVETEYTVSGQVRKTRTRYDDRSRIFSKTENLHYDEQGRISRITDGSGNTLVSNTYLAAGPLRFQDYFKDGAAGGIQFRYDFAGRVLESNHMKWTGTEWAELPTYREKLRYDEYGQVIRRDYRLGPTQASDPQKPYRSFRYAYDDFNRLISADYGVAADNGWSQVNSSTEFDESIRYNADGNIVEMGRGANASNRALYKYQDGTHKLTGVEGLIRPGGLSRAGANYTYDGSGNLVFDKGLKRKVRFGWNGKPEENISCSTLNSAGNDCASIKSHFFFVYDAQGNRAAKVKVNHD
jgi:hypothetical protein